MAKSGRFKTWQKIISGSILLILLLVFAIWVMHYQLLYGPALEDTPISNSLAPDIQKSKAWDPKKLQIAREYMDEAGSTSVIVIQNGEHVAEWGETDKVSSLHSVRKSIVSALYGIAVDKGLIDINQTFEELNIDDNNPFLTPQEKQARLEDLLTSRSGIYHPSIKDDNGPSPEPGSHLPNTYFHYNNWSFNAIGIIFKQLTQMKLGEAFEAWIAQPTGMQDFQVEYVRYTEGV